MTLFIVSGLLLSLYFNQKVGFKKYEYALLRVMGMDIKDIIQLNLFEYLFFVSKSGLISLVSVLVVGNFIEPLFNLTYSLKFIEMIGLLCFFLFISILVPIVLSVVKVNKYDPAVIFRD